MPTQHTHILTFWGRSQPAGGERREGKEAIYLYVNGPAYAGDGASQTIASDVAAVASVAGNEVRESQEIFSPTTLLFSAGCCRGCCWDKVLINSIPFSPPALPLFSLYCPEWGSCKKWRELRRHCCVSILILARGRPNQISYLHSMTHLSLLHVLHYSALSNRNTHASFSKCLLC